MTLFTIVPAFTYQIMCLLSFDSRNSFLIQLGNRPDMQFAFCFGVEHMQLVFMESSSVKISIAKIYLAKHSVPRYIVNERIDRDNC